MVIVIAWKDNWMRKRLINSMRNAKENKLATREIVVDFRNMQLDVLDLVDLKQYIIESCNFFCNSVPLSASVEATTDERSKKVVRDDILTVGIVYKSAILRVPEPDSFFAASYVTRRSEDPYPQV